MAAQTLQPVTVLLPTRVVGSHEAALLSWLADAIRDHAFSPVIEAPEPATAQACTAAGLGPWLAPGAPAAPRSRLGWLRTLVRTPPGRPVLLAPGMLHAAAWLLVAAVLLRRRVWVYVPMAYTAVEMGFSHGPLRDRVLSPWLRRVAAWITVDSQQTRLLRTHWRVRAPIHELPHLARLQAPLPSPPKPAADGRLRVAFVGRFDPWQKGLDWLSTLLRNDRTWIEACQWRFQGRGEGEVMLLELAALLGPQHARVESHAPLNAALSCSDVLLLPSRFEGLPLIALEATACGWPVVASRRCNLQGLLPAASLFDFGDPADLRRALEALRQPEARTAAVTHARERLQQMRSELRYAAALTGLVQALAPPPAAAHAC
jgi:glycosyltransferase involved in cell wall biosynthesis